mgnify:CR=1 FL=1
MAEITFKGIVTKATTTVDGGWRIYIDLGFDESEKITQLIEHKDQILQFAAIPMPSSGAL